MRDRLKQLREAAARAVDAARAGPADALKNVTESMLRKAGVAGVPPDAVAAGSQAAAKLWTKISPNDPLAYARLGEALVRDGLYDEALTTLRESQGEGPGELLAEAWLARAEVAKGDLGQGVGRIKNVAARLGNAKAQGAQIRGVLAAAAVDAGRPNLAFDMLDDGGHDPFLSLSKARLWLAVGEYEKAGAALPEDFDESQIWHGVIAAAQDDTKGAWASLSSVRFRGPDRAYADATMGWLRLEGGGAGAEPFLKQALDRLSGHPGAVYLLGLLAERGGELAEARRYYKLATDRDRRWGPPWLGLVRVGIATGDNEGARQAAEHVKEQSKQAIVAGLTSALVGDTEKAEEAWSRLLKGQKDRDLLKDVMSLRAATACHLSASGYPEHAAEVWKEVAAKASHAGSHRLQFARWAVDAARRALEASQPPYFVVESALKAASALRPESEGLVVAHCAASFLARGPASSRSSLERAVARGASDGRILGLLGLLDAATKGGPMPNLPEPKSSSAADAAKKARDGDADGCLRALEEVEKEKPLPPVRAVVKGARALAELAKVVEWLRTGRFDLATKAMVDAMDHLPEGVDRDRVLHDLAATHTIAARRYDAETRGRGEPPPPESLYHWQEALRRWSDLGAAPAYWADLSRRILELDDPRLNPRDGDALRASVHSIAVGMPAACAKEAVTAGHALRCRAFVNLILGAPVTEPARKEALHGSLEPLTDEASRIADAAKENGVKGEPRELRAMWQASQGQVRAVLAQLEDAAPHELQPTIDARDDMALGLVKYFENLHDRAADYRSARAALVEAIDVAGSQTLTAELQGKLARLDGRR